MKKAILAAAVLVASSNAFALTGFLESESTNGMHKYCKYSNGVIITISIVSLCPLSING